MFVNRHVCMLPEWDPCEYVSPSAGWCRHFPCVLRAQLEPCAWHHGTALFIRSRSSLAHERHRQSFDAYWFIWHPYSPIRFYWDCVWLVVNFAAFIYMPLQVFIPCSDRYDPFILFCDVIAFLTIFANGITGRAGEDGKQVILNFKSIIKIYCRGRFIFDLIGALPLQVIQWNTNCDYPTHTAAFLLKLFRIPSMFHAAKNFVDQFDLSYVKYLLLSLFVQTVMYFHWMTYLHYQVPAVCMHWYPFKHASMSRWLKKYKVDPKEPPLEKYITNLYYAVGQCVGAGMYDPVEEKIIPEMLLSSTLGILGLLCLVYIFTALLRLVMYGQFGMFLYNGRLKELQDYLAFKRLPLSLQTKIQLFINYKFNGNYFNEASILKTLNEKIKQDINMFCCKKLVMNVPLFQDLPIALINTIIFSLRQLLYMPGEKVVKYGQPGSSIYLIASGTVAVMNVAGKEVAHLKDGAFFGEKALLTPGTLRSASIIALEITEIYKLTHQQFQTCLQLCPRILRRFAARGRTRSSP